MSNPLNTAWHHIRRSPFQTTGTLLVMILNFFVLTSFMIISLGLSTTLNFFETKPEITIFLKDNIDSKTIENVQKELSNYSGVREIRYISKEKALELYKEQNKNKPLLLEMVTANILPASFEVSANSQETLSQIAQNFSGKTTIVDEIIYPEDVIKPLLNITETLRKFGAGLIAVLSTISFILVVSSITMKITSRKDEIFVSRLLGANKWYIKAPFLYEGIFYGIVSSLLGWGISFGVAWYMSPTINNFFKPVEFISTTPYIYLQILAICMVAGVLTGLLASLVGVRRYIKY